MVAARLVNKETLTFTSNLFPPLLTRIAKAMLDIHPLNRPDVSTSIQQFEKGLLFPKKMVLSKERDAVQVSISSLYYFRLEAEIIPRSKKV